MCPFLPWGDGSGDVLKIFIDPTVGRFNVTGVIRIFI